MTNVNYSNIRLRAVRNNKGLLVIEAYNPELDGFKMRIRNYGPYKTASGAVRGMKEYARLQGYSDDQLDAVVE
jgi:hypothetical protein